MHRRRFVLGAALLLALFPGGFHAEEPAELPRRISGTVSGAASRLQGEETRIAVTIERWSTDAERKAATEALKSGGSGALIAALKKSDVGYMELSGSGGYRLRFATTFTTEHGRIIRAATDRPIGLGDGAKLPSRDFPLGMLELVYPPEGRPTGTLLVAAKVRFDEKGNLEVQSLPPNAWIHPIAALQDEPLKRKSKGAEK